MFIENNDNWPISDFVDPEIAKVSVQNDLIQY